MDTSGLYKGMEKGYEESSMGRLHKEYLSSGELYASTYNSVQLLATQTKLSKGDIWDRGVAKVDSPPRFQISPTLLSRISRVSAELQEFLRRAAALIPGRTTFFVVDPEDSCLPILSGAQDLHQLEAAWELLRSRLELGHRFFLKYTEEFKDKETAPVSPAST
ncbi:hypothetical protein R3P38DRAFT_2565369, partial [Favolaschia claudopus]